ncbi:MAG: hypothetical protein IKJ68_12370 [Clostridia bacterium]|nr:hypothetical protein [Clostridia bacterium]
MKKIKNFLYYEWKKIVAVLFVLILVVVTVKQCNNKVLTDLGVLYIGDVRTENFSSLKEELESAGIVADADSDGKVIINTKEILIPQSEEIKLEQQVPQQIQFEVISGENLLYVVDKQTARNNAVEMSFADITEVAQKFGISEDACLKYSDGKIFAIPLEGNKLFEDLGINNTGMFIAQRNYTEENKNTPLNLNARKAMEYILEKSN